MPVVVEQIFKQDLEFSRGTGDLCGVLYVWS